MEQIYRTYKDLFLLGGLMLPLGGLVILAFRLGRRHRPDAWRSSVLDVLICCACVPAVGFTLAGGATFDNPRFQVVPLRDVIDQLAHAVSLEMALIQIFGNLVLLAALGGLLPVRLCPFTSWRVLVAFAVGVALSIETAQGFLGRVASIDDLLLNSAGVLLGGAPHPPVVAYGHTDSLGRGLRPRPVSRLTAESVAETHGGRGG